MPRIPRSRRHTLEAIVERTSPVRGRRILAIDGVDGAGKSMFADDLVAVMGDTGLSGYRASMDGFHRPRAERYARGRDSAEGYYRDSYDYSAFRRSLVDPFRMGGSAAFVPAVFDVRRNSWLEPEWLTAPEDAVLVVDGIFLHRPELRELWDESIWLEVEPGIAAARLLERDGPTEHGERYREGQQLYLEECDPSALATLVVRNDYWRAPIIAPRGLA
jgi:uridine kinase